jgi:hypothetical protein
MRLLCLAAAVSLAIWAQGAPSRISSVEPAHALVSEELVITGTNLSKAAVSDLFLTLRDDDFPLQILEQTDTNIRCRMPGDLKPGRFSLTILTSGDAPAMIEQPVKVHVETTAERASRKEREAELARVEEPAEPAEQAQK